MATRSVVKGKDWIMASSRFKSRLLDLLFKKRGERIAKPERKWCSVKDIKLR